MEMLNIKINGKDYQVEKNTTILEACHQFGIKVPTLCYLKEINEIGACRMCLCEVKGARSLVAACVYPIDREGTEIFTNTPQIRKYRKMNLELLLSNHDKKCLSCPKNTNCELQQLCVEYGVNEKKYKDGEDPIRAEDHSTLHLVRNNNKCILCRRCVAACKQQYVSVIGTNNRGRPENIAAGLLASQQEGLRDLARRRHAHVPLDPREVVANVAADFLGARAY